VAVRGWTSATPLRPTSRLPGARNRSAGVSRWFEEALMWVLGPGAAKLWLGNPPTVALSPAPAAPPRPRVRLPARRWRGLCRSCCRSDRLHCSGVRIPGMSPRRFLTPCVAIKLSAPRLAGHGYGGPQVGPAAWRFASC
jgi:hypothetical protein